MPTAQQTSADINQLNIKINELQERHNAYISKAQTAPTWARTGLLRSAAAVEAEITRLTAERDQLLGLLRQDVATEFPTEEATLLQQLKAKYPAAPAHLDVEGLNHLEYLFSDPVGFFRDVAITFTRLRNESGETAAQEYANAIREITLASIPPDHYFPMFEALDLNHVNFAVWHIYPEHMTYNIIRWIFGRDARPEELFTAWNNEAARYIAANDEPGYLNYKTWVLNQLKALQETDPGFAEPLKTISTKTQAEFIKNYVPELIDTIDLANIDSATTGTDAKTIMILGGIGVAATLLFFGIGGKKKNGAPKLIKT